MQRKLILKHSQNSVNESKGLPTTNKKYLEDAVGASQQDIIGIILNNSSKSFVDENANVNGVYDNHGGDHFSMQERDLIDEIYHSRDYGSRQIGTE